MTVDVHVPRLSRRIPIFFLLTSILAFSGCGDSLLWAVGKTEKLGLLTNLPGDDDRVGLLAGIMTKPVQMVRPENRFLVEPIPLGLFDSNRNWKAIAVLTDLSRPGSLDDVISQMISKADRERMASRDADYQIIESVWANGQAVILIHAKNSAALTEFLTERGDAMVERYEVALQVAIGPAVLAIGQDLEMKDYLREQHGFEIGIPNGYTTSEDPEANVVRLVRVITGEPVRFLMIHWVPAAEAPSSNDELFAIRDRLGDAYLEGDYVLRDRSSGFEGSFQGEPATLLEGVWQNDKHVIGGPFRTFGFVRGNRYFMVDASVYNPPGSKLPYLREALAIARTFRVLESS